MTVHALTIDLEDWHQLFHRRLTGEVIRPTPTVVSATLRLLDMLDETGTRATFFVVGNVAETYPGLVREVARRGHEIGSHTYSHELIFRLQPAAFKADVERSLARLQDLTGQPVLGFRAPEFSVGHLEHWCFEVLVELGFRYDSSVFPLPRLRYGIPEAPRHPFAITTPSGAIHEYPLATWDAGPLRLLMGQFQHVAGEIDTDNAPSSTPSEVDRVHSGSTPDVEDLFARHVPGPLERDGIALENGLPERRIDPAPEG